MTGFVGAMRHRSQRRQETAGRTVAVSVKVNRPERVLAKRRQELRNVKIFNAVIIIIMTGFVGAMRHRSQRRQETAGRTVAVSVKVNRPERVLAKRRQELRNVKSE
ncbi:hypothetical protein QE152_g35819 [Popillia japonica]|uniref:Transmembrane protein n=1 Tax=Popillia japonica TaxID=7064 RepID=A0AAW1IET2_POPJA